MPKLSNLLSTSSQTPIVMGTSFQPQMCNDIRSSVIFCIRICVFIPRAAICPGPLQRFKKMTVIGSFGASKIIPMAVIRPGPLQHFEMTVLGSFGASEIIPRAAIRPGPFQDFKVAVFGSFGGQPFALTHFKTSR